MGLDTLLSCTIGGASFQLEQYSIEESPQIKDGAGRIGTEVRIAGSGSLTAATAANLETEMGATISSLRSSGQRFAIRGPAGDIYVLSPDYCVEGGPHFSFKVVPGAAMLQRRIEFTLEAKTANTGGTSGGAAYEDRTSVRVDDKETVTRTGELRGSDGPRKYFATVLPGFRASFPWPAWVVTHEYSTTEKNDGVKYSLTARQVFGVLPRDGTAAGALDGTARVRTERDEQHRLVTTYDYDLLYAGDPMRLLAVLRPTVKDSKGVPGAAKILRESSDIQTLGEPRLTASFTVLSSADEYGVLNWRQSLEFTRGAETVEERRYPGSAPVLVAKPQGVARLVQSGAAVGFDGAVIPPEPLAAIHLEAPQVTYAPLNDYEWETRWRYVLAAESQTIPLTTLQRATGQGMMTAVEIS